MERVLKPYSDYKGSGIPWLGMIPSHWETRRAKWLFAKMERPVRPEDETITCFRDGVVTLRKNRRTTGFTESLQEIGYQGIRKGDLVIHAMDAFAGAVGVSDSDGKGTPVYVVCKPNPGVDAEYYARVVREMARSQYIAALAKGIRQRSTDFRYATFAGEELPTPPPEEQYAIARFLGEMERRVNRLIRAKQRLIALLNEQKQAIIQRAVTRGLDPDVRLKPSGVEWLGEVPEHWEIIPFKYLTTRVQNGATPPTISSSYYENGTTPWYGPAAISGDVEVSRPSRLLTQRAFAEGGARMISPPAILVVVIGTAGKMALLRHEGATNQQITACELNVARVDPEFCLHQLRLAETAFRSSASSATIPILDIGVVLRSPVALPAKDEQHEIIQTLHDLIRPLDRSIDRTMAEIDLVREYRTRLIADVVTGKLDVRGVDVPDVAHLEELLETEIPGGEEHFSMQEAV